MTITKKNKQIHNHNGTPNPSFLETGKTNSKKVINKDVEHLNNIFNTMDLTDILSVQETDTKMGLDVPEVYWGNCLRRIKRRKQE